MGDKPIRTPNIWECPLSPYPGGMVPNKILVTISGVSRGPNWRAWYPEPPNGTYELTFLNCTNWAYQDDDLRITVSIEGSPGVCYCGSEVFGAGALCGGSDDFGDISAGNNVYTPDAYSGGHWSCTTYKNGGPLPASWDAAPLVVIPEQIGMFAEELPCEIAPRKCRYARHSDRSNIKIYGDY